MKIAVIGAGSWGTALAQVLAGNGHNVGLWARKPEVAAAINDVQMREVQLEPGFTLDAEKLLAAADENTRLLFLCSPNNPTGTVLSREALQRWVDYANATDAVILFDAAYERFIADPAIPHSIFPPSISFFNSFNNQFT